MSTEIGASLFCSAAAPWSSKPDPPPHAASIMVAAAPTDMSASRRPLRVRRIVSP